MGNVDPDFKIALEAYGMSLEDVNIKELSAGDVSTVPYKQIIIAMGEGAKAALAAFEDRMRGEI